MAVRELCPKRGGPLKGYVGRKPDADSPAPFADRLAGFLCRHLLSRYASVEGLSGREVSAELDDGSWGPLRVLHGLKGVGICKAGSLKPENWSS